MPPKRVAARGRKAARASATSRREPRENAAPSPSASVQQPDPAPPSAPTSVTIPLDQLRSLVGEVVREVLPTTAAHMAVEPPAHIAPAEDVAFPQALESTSGSDPAVPVLSQDCGNPAPVSATIRQRIIEDKYVDLGTLLETSDQPEDKSATFQLVNGTLRAAPRAPRTIHTFGGWSLAFLKFTGIYLEAHPDAAAGLLAHMRQVGQLTAPGLGLAWREFDEKFRRAREIAPDQYEWGSAQTSSALWLQSVARGVGGAAKNRSAGSLPPTNRRFRTCFSFNRPGGCTSRPCRFQHSCLTCNGPHPATRCPRRQSGAQSYAPRAMPGGHRALPRGTATTATSQSC